MEKDVVIYRNKKDSHRQCKVVFSYQPVHPDELALNVGDVIDIVGEDEEGWWKGIHNGKEGVFPSNFVEEIFPSKPKTKSGSREDLTIVNDNDVRIPNLPPKPARILCEVKYAYKAQNEDELTLKEGDIITLTNRDIPDPGWWEGELNGRIGVFPDNFVVIIKQHDDKPTHQDDPKHARVISDIVPPKPAAPISQRTSLEPKNDVETKLNPPILKKPDLFKKISPSSVSKGFRGFVGNRKSDSVDGIASSKGHQLKNDNNVKIDTRNEKNGEDAFDHVERTPLLKDVRAGRAKPPIRRPPTAGVATKDKLPAIESEEIVSLEEEVQESKPSMREWEKHRAPWLEEMKLNQAKRSSTSPISEKNLNTKALYPELDKTLVDGVMSKSMPCPAASKISPNEVVDGKPPTSKVKPNNLQNVSRSNYSNVDIPSLVNNFISTSPNSRVPEAFTLKHNKNSNEEHAANDSGCSEKFDLHNRVSGEFIESDIMSITVQQYSELLSRIQRLETIVEMQASAIEDLRARWLIHNDKRKSTDQQKLT